LNRQSSCTITSISLGSITDDSDDVGIVNDDGDVADDDNNDDDDDDGDDDDAIDAAAFAIAIATVVA
ncbi:hypothetical protein WUBG_16539, partial [Wuchereria bancrofti]